ncbi:hypothetical protein AMAG_01236 [Allomyces macrogynus ATCC 38327]|uniref:Uncharacterized protein n=1 Tax=Allomyces macrogynus (strain ATCC 38327) TaxID=578462 RepID=A0A0L0RZ29_ALLM3|nr:hypothetical protein AMAG_01236 [Allomyces macrogynus ATCC 38327]|eukprot:KNE55334.1 hypothetical protein AMAG_01236 [Allomyces macrogynus ATCC 38327]
MAAAARLASRLFSSAAAKWTGQVVPGAESSPASHSASLPGIDDDLALHLPTTLTSLSTDSLAVFTASVASLLWHAPPIPSAAPASLATRLTTSPHLAQATPAVTRVVATILAATRLSPWVVVLALTYVQRLSTLAAQCLTTLVPGSGSELRVLTVALMLAGKWLDDNPFSMPSWALVSGMPARDLATMERESLALLQWDLALDPIDGARWAHSLANAVPLVLAPPIDATLPGAFPTLQDADLAPLLAATVTPVAATPAAMPAPKLAPGLRAALASVSSSSPAAPRQNNRMRTSSHRTIPGMVLQMLASQTPLALAAGTTGWPLADVSGNGAMVHHQIHPWGSAPDVAFVPGHLVASHPEPAAWSTGCPSVAYADGVEVAAPCRPAGLDESRPPRLRQRRRRQSLPA